MARPLRIILMALGAAVAAVGCYQAPADMAQAEMILGLTDAMEDLRHENAILQEQIDSLHILVTRQDSLVRRVAEQVGIPVPR